VLPHHSPKQWKRDAGQSDADEELQNAEKGAEAPVNPMAEEEYAEPEAEPEDRSA
jgi:hypothetical protein